MCRWKQYILPAIVMFALFPSAFTQVQDSAASATSANATTGNCAPPAYSCARSDLITTHNLNPPPNVSQGKNALVTPSDFNLPIVRVTDGSLFEDRTFAETPSASAGDNIFNTNDTYMLITDLDGWRYPVSFNPSTMQVENSSAWTMGKNQQRWAGSSSFSRVDASAVFTVMDENVHRRRNAQQNHADEGNAFGHCLHFGRR